MHKVLNLQFTQKSISCCGKWWLLEAIHVVTLLLVVQNEPSLQLVSVT
jgi:hypothetical protein